MQGKYNYTYDVCCSERFLYVNLRVFDKPQYKNANIAKFIPAVPFKINNTNEVCNLEM